MNPLLNPIVLGLFAGVITYMYLSWLNKSKYEKKKRKNKNKNKKIKCKSVDLTLPIIVSIGTWLSAYLYHENCEINSKKKLENISEDKQYSLSKENESSDERSYRMIKTGINVPRNLQEKGSDKEELPDVFINVI